MTIPLPSPSQLQSLARGAVARVLRQWPAGRHLSEDLEQEAVLAALTALRLWDASKASWSTRAWWAMKTALRRFLLQNVGPVTQPFSKEPASRAPRAVQAELPPALSAATPAPDSRALAKLAIAALMRAAAAALRPAYRSSNKALSYDDFVRRDVEVFLQVVAFGEPVSEVAHAAFLSRQSVYTCLGRVAEALAAAARGGTALPDPV